MQWNIENVGMIMIKHLVMTRILALNNSLAVNIVVLSHTG